MTLVFWSISIAILAVIISRGKGSLSTNNYFYECKNIEYHNRSFLLLFLLWIFYSIIFGCRQGFVDTSTYKLMAERIGDSFSNLSNSEVAVVEQGFNAWMILCNKISNSDSQFFIFLTTMITLAGVFAFFYKESSDSGLSTFFFIALFSFTYINGIRQAIVAVAFVLLYSKWRNRKILMIIVCVCLSLFHTSALLLIPLYLCINGDFFNWKIKTLFLFSFFCVIGTGQVQQILNIILNERYIESLNAMTSGTGIMRVTINLLPFVLALFQHQIHGIKDNKDAEILNVFLVDAAINICALRSTYFARMSIYFAIFIAAYYPGLLHRVFNRKSQSIAYTLFITFYSAFYLYQAYTFYSYGYLREFYLFFQR